MKTTLGYTIMEISNLKIKGITYVELFCKTIERVEVETKSGSRYWIESSQFADKIAFIREVNDIKNRGELRDSDIAPIERQPVEIRECLMEVVRLGDQHSWSINWQELFEMYGQI